MADPAPTPAPPIFNFNAYSPAEIQDAIEQVGVKKANMPLLPSLMLAAVAGGSIGLGALYYSCLRISPIEPPSVATRHRGASHHCESYIGWRGSS